MDKDYISKDSEILQYRFLPNKPTGKDLFKNESQQKIATVISEKIIHNPSFKVIGIDGTWGSGKSNLVHLIEKKLEKSHKFFIYDVWGHQEDDQRHSILTEITDFISDSQKDLVNDKSKWKDRLTRLISKQRNITTTNIPHLSIGFIISLLLIIYIPTVNTFTKDLNIYWKIFLVLLPILLLTLLYLRYYLKIRKVNIKNDKDVLKRYKRIKKYGSEAAQQLFKVYNNQKVDETKIEIISEREPTVKEFREWMDEIDKDLKTKVVIVFDNFDRLPKKHILSIWSSIHIFFSEKEYKNIRVILPFDREHVQNAFKELNSDDDNKTFADDYVNKTFDIVFRISLPIMSDWKKFFRDKWKEAFIQIDEDELEKVIQVYEFLNRRITPREIIAFINEILTIKHLDENLKERYIAIFTLCKDHILSNPLSAIVNLDYLNGLQSIYSNDADYAKQITAIVYHIPIDKALELIYTEQLKQALNKNDFTLFNDICNAEFINDIFFSVINDLEELSNPILTLEKISLDSKVSEYNLNEAWETFYSKTLSKGTLGTKMKVEDWELALLKKAKDNRYLKNLLKHYRFMSDNFDILEYINILDFLFKELEKENVQVFLLNKDVVPDKLLKIVASKGETYLEYMCICKDEELDEHLIQMSIDDLLKIKHSSVLAKDFNLPKYKAILIAKLNEYASSNNLTSSNLTLIKLKETVDENGDLKDSLNENLIYNLYTNYSTHQPPLPIIDELIAMRIAKGNNFSPSYNSAFIDKLNSDNEELAKSISSTILNYIDYGDLLLSANTFTNSVLYKNIINMLMSKNEIEINADKINQLIYNYVVIKQSLEIEDNKLLLELNSWEIDFEEVDFENLSDELIKDCFENRELKLSQRFVDKFNEFKDWDEEMYLTIFENEEDIHFRYFEELDDSSLNQFSLNAFKNQFLKNLKDNTSVRDIWKKAFEKYESNNSVLSVQNLLKDIRDKILNSQIDFNIEKALYLIPFFLKYNILDDTTDIFRKVFKTEFLSEDNFLELIEKDGAIIKQLYQNSKQDEKADFRNTINEYRETDDRYEKIAKIIDIRKTKPIKEE